MVRKHTCDAFSLFTFIETFFNGLEYGLPWRMFHGSLKRMFILLLLGRVFYQCVHVGMDGGGIK